jgi:hypothetical protein
MAEEFEHILDECIDCLLRGESLGQCLQRYPEQAAQLEPLLRVALATQKASSVEPRTEFKVQARQQLSSVLYKQKPEVQPGRVPLLDLAKSRIRGAIKGLRSRPVWQKALASALAVALIVGLCLTIPALLGQSPVALAEEVAMEDPGVQILLIEKGFDPLRVHRAVVKADGGSIYYVYLMNPGDNAPIGTVTVDMEKRMVTKIGLIESSEQFIHPPGPAGVSEEDILQIAERDPSVQEILGSGAEVGRMAYLFSPQRQVVGLELRLGAQRWLVQIDLTKEEVISIFER